MLELADDVGANWFLDLFEAVPTPEEAANVREKTVARILISRTTASAASTRVMYWPSCASPLWQLRAHPVEMFLSARRALEFSHNQDPKWTSNVIRSPHGRATGTPRASISLSSSLFRLRGHVNCAEWAEACLRGCPPCQRMRRTGPRPESATARPGSCHRHQSLASSRPECHRPR